MSSSINLDKKLKQLSKQLVKKRAVVYETIEDFIKAAGFPVNASFDIPKYFKEVVIYCRNVKKVDSPDLTLWTFVRDGILGGFEKHGYSEKRFLAWGSRCFGYDRARPNDDWQGDRNKRISLVRIKSSAEKEEQKDLHKAKVDEQIASIGTADAKDIAALLKLDTKNKKEQDIRDERERKYKNDFNLNDTSDHALLQVVLDCEMILTRMKLFLSVNDNKFIAAEMDRQITRLTQALRDLGIVRNAREDKDVTAEGTIADLIETFDAFDFDKDFSLLCMLEEIEMALQRFDRGDMQEFLFKHNIGIGIDEAREIYAKNKGIMKELDDKLAARML